MCERTYCIPCITSNYDQNATLSIDPKGWICPYCQGVCYCSRCLRHDQLIKMRAFFLSLGGTSYELKLQEDTVHDYISKNIEKTIDFLKFDESNLETQEFEKWNLDILTKLNNKIDKKKPSKKSKLVTLKLLKKQNKQLKSVSAQLHHLFQLASDTIEREKLKKINYEAKIKSIEKSLKNANK